MSFQRISFGIVLDVTDISVIISPTFPTGISFIPSVRRIFARYPSSGASYPMTALSVSISHSKSPSESLSPSFFFHETMLPFCIVGDRAGNAIAKCFGRSINFHLVTFEDCDEILQTKVSNGFLMTFLVESLQRDSLWQRDRPPLSELFLWPNDGALKKAVV